MIEARLKFKPLSYYEPKENSPYTLLPFNFTSLDSNRYVVTNLAGEYIILAKNDLNLLVKKQLPSSSEVYNDLMAKHFSYDDNSDVAIRLLALKYR